MTYTKTIKPSEIYIDPQPRKRIQELLKNENYKITEFRPPLMGEEFISDTYEIFPCTYNYSEHNLSARFIVEKLPEPSKKYFPEWE